MSTATTPSLAEIRDPAASKALCQRIKDAMAAAGLPRLSKLNGGEVKGLIDKHTYGSTGFSVAMREGGKYEQIKRPHLNFNVVLSGKAAGLRYEEEYDFETDECEGESPVNPEKLCPQVRRVFEAMGFQVINVRYAGHQMMWDDDVEFAVDCEMVR